MSEANHFKLNITIELPDCLVAGQTFLERPAKSLSDSSCFKRFYLEISVTFCGYDAPDV